MSDTRTTWKKRKKSKHWMKKNWKKCEGTKKKLEKNMRVPKTKLETNLQYPKKCKICNTQKSAMFQLNYSDFRSIKKFWENSRFMKKNWKKNLGVPKKNWENLWQKLEKMWGTKNKTGDKSAIPKKVQILNVSNIVDKKVQILNVSNIVPPNIVDTNIRNQILKTQIFGIKYCTHFWRGMKILSIYPNVGHSKSGFAHSFPRVEYIPGEFRYYYGIWTPKFLLFDLP